MSLCHAPHPAGGSADTSAEVAGLQREIELLRAKVEAHPEVKRFAVENLKLSEARTRMAGGTKGGLEVGSAHSKTSAHQAAKLCRPGCS